MDIVNARLFYTENWIKKPRFRCAVRCWKCCTIITGNGFCADKFPRQRRSCPKWIKNLIILHKRRKPLHTRPCSKGISAMPLAFLPIGPTGPTTISSLHLNRTGRPWIPCMLKSDNWPNTTYWMQRKRLVFAECLAT